MRVLVTGAASGIGRATCLRLARDAKAQGRAGKIVAVDVASSPGLDGVVAELKALGAETLPLHADMSTAEGPARAVAEAVKGAATPDETLRRVAPADGTRLLVAASFNSAI